MAEALAIVGLASNVVQFLDAAGNFFSMTYELYNSGSLAENSEIQTRTSALQASLEILQQGRGTIIDKTLQVLVEACFPLSTDMMALLEEVKPVKRKIQLLQASSTSLKMMRKRKKIKDIEKRLEKMRDGICAHLTILLRQKNDELTVHVKDLTVLTQTFQHDNSLRLDSLALEVQRLIDRKDWGNGNLGESSKLATQLRLFTEEAGKNKHVVRVLKSLHFKQIKERHSDIRDAHQETLEWIFDPSSGVNFTSWLSSSDVSDGIYWITGKAGSGKSTLMKFIQNHPQTFQLLLQGAPAHDIIIATHYFWSAGTSLQKSQVGLFRTLLFQILSQSPGMIPLVIPDRWNKSFASLESWSRSELLGAFKRLAALRPKQKLKICLFVDGLDEYGGDHWELATIFCVLSQAPHLKLCLSSRPWQEFIDAFGKSKWTLRVQELTKNDIRLYIRDNLEQDNRFLELCKQDKQGADQLAQEIQMKAQGVFLWVYLVVRSLLRGLANSDKMENLHRRLYDLPTELENYFELMLSTIEPIYRRQTAQVFSVMLASSHTLPIVAFHFLNETHSGSDIKPWSPKTIDDVVEEQRRQLNASCRDLLYTTTDPEESQISMVKVGFLHRTVIDFLRTGPMETLLSRRSGAGFNPNLSLCKTYWAMYQAHPSASDNSMECIREREDLIAGTIHYAREVERQSEHPAKRVLDQVSSQVESTAWPQLVGDDSCRCFLDVAVRFDLQLYVVAQMRQIEAESRHDMSRNSQIATLLRQALRAELSVEKDDTFGFMTTDRIGLSMLQCLLENGANPNANLDKTTDVPRSETFDNDLADRRFGETFKYESPEVNRSVWADFLFELQVNAPRPDNAPVAWDMRNFFDPSTQKQREGLKHSHEACELLIRYGARRDYQKKQGILLKGVRDYMLAEDALNQVFPDEAGPLLRLLDKVQGKEKWEYGESSSSCVVM